MIEEILSRLDKVKRSGPNNWMACCPAHDDRSPSMTIHAADDGRIAVFCHAGCSFEEIKDAVGLGWEPWFPPKQAEDRAPLIRRPFPAGDVLEALAAEVQIVTLICCDMHKKKEISEDDYTRLWVAYERIEEGRRLALGERR